LIVILFMCALASPSTVRADTADFAVGCPSSEPFQAERGMVTQVPISIMTYGGSSGYVDLELSISGLPTDTVPQSSSDSSSTLRAEFPTIKVGVVVIHVGEDALLGDFPVTIYAQALNGDLSGQVRNCQFTLSIKNFQKFITIDLSASTVKTNEAVTARGLVGYHVPIGNIVGTYTIRIETSSNSGWKTIGETWPGNTDEYSYSWTPSEPGLCQVRAQWVLESVSEPERVIATSETKTVTVEQGVKVEQINALIFIVIVCLIIAVATIGVLVKRSRPAATNISQRVCSQCGFVNPPFARSFCVKCGNPLASQDSRKQWRELSCSL